MEYNYIIVLDNIVYKINTNMDYLFDDCFTKYEYRVLITTSFINIDHDKKHESMNYLAINLISNKIWFDFGKFILYSKLVSHQQIKYFVGKSGEINSNHNNKITNVGDKMTAFIEKSLENKSDESVLQFFNYLCEYADKFIALYDMLGDITVGNMTKSATSLI